MLLTITTTHNPATDLGYLLHKNPARVHSEEMSFGKVLRILSASYGGALLSAISRSVAK